MLHNTNINKTFCKKNNGFTLIEIVMILVLIGILASIAIPRYFDLREKAEEAVAKTVEQELQARLDGAFAASMLSGGGCGSFKLDYVLKFPDGTESPGTGSDVTGIANALVVTFNQESELLKVWVSGSDGNNHIAPLMISVDGGKSFDKYTGKLIFPECVKTSNN